jgi:hypothetical protein
MSFFQDWGPLNLAMVYKACILFHELLQVRRLCGLCHHSSSCRIKDRDLAGYGLVLYSSNDPRRKANAALLMALYVVRSHAVQIVGNKDFIASTADCPTPASMGGIPPYS